MARGYMPGSGGAGGADVSVVTATASDVLIGKIFVDSTESPVTGTMPSKGAETYNTSASDQFIAAGQYLSGVQTIKAVTTDNISAANIKKGVTVSVGDENDDGRIANVEGTYTTVSSGQTPVVAEAMLSGYSGFADGGAEVKGNIATKTSSDMTVSGATVTAPAGYYASNASKAIPAGTATGAGSGQQSAPSISIDSAGKITASVAAKTISCTPSVSAGYISSGTAGNVSLTANSATKQMTTKAVTTVTLNASTTSTSIAAGTYLTGKFTAQVTLYDWA